MVGKVGFAIGNTFGVLGMTTHIPLFRHAVPVNSEKVVAIIRPVNSWIDSFRRISESCDSPEGWQVVENRRNPNVNHQRINRKSSKNQRLSAPFWRLSAPLPAGSRAQVGSQTYGKGPS